MTKKRKQGRTNLMIFLVVVLLLAAAFLLFRVHKVTVSGNSRHASEEIAGELVNDIFSGNTVCLWWKYRNGDIPDSMPYLESLKVTIKTPFSVLVQVSEKKLVGYFDIGEYAYFDENGIVIELTERTYDDIPVITGASIGEINLYQKVPTESSSQLRTILSLLDLLEYYGLKADEVNFAEDLSITVYIGTIAASLGQDEYMEEKIANLNAVLNTMAEGTAGTLHVENVTGKNEDIVFSPYDEKKAAAEAAAEAIMADGDNSDDIILAENAADDITSEAEDAENSEEEDAAEDNTATEGVGIMVFNSSGQLVYNVHVRDGKVVDAYGYEVSGCSVNEDGYVVDAYMNVIDPATGELLNDLVY